MTDQTPPEFDAESELPPAVAQSTAAINEQKQFAADGTIPNSFVYRFGGRGHLSWHSDTSTAVLGFIILVMLCVFALLIGLISLGSSNTRWVEIIMQALGSAITGVAGAIVGASVAGTKK